MRLILTCGGTAGHINPAIAVAERIQELNAGSEILFIGAEGRMEMELVPREGYRILPLPVSNLSRGHHLKDIRHNLDAARNLVVSERSARKILQDFQPDVVLGTGGYVCFPVLREAGKLGIPALLHESNAVPGLTTRMLADHISCLLLGYEESRSSYPGVRDVRVTGTPVRGKFGLYTRERARKELGIPAEMPLVVSMWGSLGSGHMNEMMMRMLPLMKGQKDFCVIHSTGSSYHASISRKLEKDRLNPADCNVEIREYIYDTPRVLAAADLVLCRAGASTLAELSRIGKPALIVPSPNVTNHHQEKNARLVERAGGAKVLLEGEFDEKTLLDEIGGLLRDRQRLQKMADGMAALSVRDSLDQIVDAVLEYGRKRG